MSTLQTDLGTIALDVAGTYYSGVLDTQRAASLGMTFSLANTTSPSVACTIELSNDVPSSGSYLDNGWQPASGSWFTAYSGGVAITATMTSDGILPLGVAADGLLFRWARAKVVTGSPYVGGTISLTALTK